MYNHFVSPNNDNHSHADAEVLLNKYFSERGYEKQDVYFLTWLYWDYTESPFWSVECFPIKHGISLTFRGFHIHENGEIIEIEY